MPPHATVLARSIRRALPLALFAGSVVAWAADEATPAQEAAWRAQVRQTLMVPDPLPPLDPKSHGRFEAAPGIVAERVTYGTQFGMRIPAIVYFPKEYGTRLPGLVVVNGHGGDKYSWYAIWSGILYARAGAVVLTFDPTGEGERNASRQSGTRAHDRLEPVDAPWHAELARRQAGLLVGDVMQAVSYLAQRTEVDPRRIGAMGYSLGSMITALTGAVEPRLHACVVAGGGGFGIPTGPPGNKAGGSKPSCIQGVPYRSLHLLKDPPAVIYSLNAARGATLVVNGELEWDGKPRKNPTQMQTTRQRTIAFRGRSDGIFDVSVLEKGAIHRPYFVNRDVALWLHHQMQFPNWTEGEVEAMPVTRIGDWAAQEKVEIDPMYATEGLESGTHALGANIPGLTRKQLSVFTPAEWEREKDRMTLDSWVARTLKEMGITPPPSAPSAPRSGSTRRARAGWTRAYTMTPATSTGTATETERLKSSATARLTSNVAITVATLSQFRPRQATVSANPTATHPSRRPCHTPRTIPSTGAANAACSCQ